MFTSIFYSGKEHKGHMSYKNTREIGAKTTTQALTKDSCTSKEANAIRFMCQD